MRIALLVTGKLEYLGLAQALRRLFSDHEFECVPRSTVSDQPWFDGFTSSPLPSREPRTTADVLVEFAAGLTRGDRTNRAYDLVVILDDLELANHHQPGAVVEYFTSRVRSHVEQLPVIYRQDARTRMRERVSLHFAVPMIESWLFADPAALARVGLPPDRFSLLGCDTALEDFSTNDVAYEGDNCNDCTEWQRVQRRPGLTKNKRRAHEPEWCRGTDAAAVRTRHPKRYLAWLCRDHAQKKCSRYSETAAAPGLGDINWTDMFSNWTLPYLFSLIDDLSDGLGEPCPLPAGVQLAVLTRRRNAGVLRNCD